MPEQITVGRCYRVVLDERETGGREVRLRRIIAKVLEISPKKILVTEDPKVEPFARINAPNVQYEWRSAEGGGNWTKDSRQLDWFAGNAEAEVPCE